MANKIMMFYKILLVKNLFLFKKISVFCLVFVFFFFNKVIAAEYTQLAFPGAKGFGQYSQGGVNGKLYIVDSLADNAKNPELGTLRYAIKQKHPRTIVFAVSGVIKLTAPLKIAHSYLTIAGQSSPGGITLVGAPVSISKAKHVIIRHMRFRLGTFGYAEDSLTVRDSEHIIIDHCSFSWSVDETATFYRNRHFTLQNSIIANSLNNSIHPKGKHGYGGIWGGANASFINNIIANHGSRTPRINGHRLKSQYLVEEEFVELANNIIFNWGHNNVYGSENGRFNLVNNYYKPGPASKITQIVDIWYSPLLTENQAFINGNYYEGNNRISQENWRGVNYRLNKKAKRTKSQPNSPWLSHTLLQPYKKTDSAFKPVLSAVSMFNQVLKSQNIGANRNANGTYVDSVDSYVYQQLGDEINIKNDGLINHEFESITSWQAYEKQFTQFSLITDNNKDGVDDSWFANYTSSRVSNKKSTGDTNNSATGILKLYLDALAN